MNKTCIECSKEKEESAFYKSKRCRDCWKLRYKNRKAKKVEEVAVEPEVVEETNQGETNETTEV